MNDPWLHAINPLPSLEVRRATLGRLGEAVNAILASTGMTEDELVDAPTRDHWHSSDNDADTEAARTDPSLRSG